MADLRFHQQPNIICKCSCFGFCKYERTKKKERIMCFDFKNRFQFLLRQNYSPIDSDQLPDNNWNSIQWTSYQYRCGVCFFLYYYSVFRSFFPHWGFFSSLCRYLPSWKNLLVLAGNNHDLANFYQIMRDHLCMNEEKKNKTEQEQPKASVHDTNSIKSTTPNQFSDRSEQKIEPLGAMIMQRLLFLPKSFDDFL